MNCVNKKPDKLSSYLKEEYVLLILLVVTGLIFDIGMSFTPKMLGNIIDAIDLNKSYDIVIRLGLYYFLFVLFIQTNRFFKRFIVREFSVRTLRKMRRVFYNLLLQEQTCNNLDVSSNKLTILTGDVEDVCEGIRKTLTEIFDTGVLMISYFVTMVLMDFNTTLFSCIFIPLTLLLSLLLRKAVYKKNQAYRKSMSNLTAVTYDLLENCEDYRFHNSLTTKIQSYEYDLSILKNEAISADFLNMALKPIYYAISMLGVGFVAYFGFKNVFSNQWTSGDFFAYMSLFLLFTEKSSKVNKLFNSIQKARVSWKRVKPNLQPRISTTSNGITPFNSLQFVDFSPLSSHTLDYSLNVTLKTGTILGVTGSVASGKTMLLKSLLGICVSTGKLIYGNIDLNQLSFKERSQYFSYVSHDAYLFSGTLVENITLSNTFDEGKLSKCLYLARLDVDISTFEKGIYQEIGPSGNKLSGGQKLRVAYARALYADRPIWVFDDPFSSLDLSTSEAMVNDLLSEIGNHIVVMTSHQVFQFPQFTNVLMLDGKSTMISNHEEVYKTNKKYKEVFDLQVRSLV